MKWNSWVISNSNKNIFPPAEWCEVLKILHESNLIEDKIIDKIEVAAFTIRGSRILRWKIDESDPQFATEDNSFRVAKKLLANYLEVIDLSIQIPEKLKPFLANYLTSESTKCSLCREEITTIMFVLDGRTEQDAINMGHIEPLNTRDQNQSNHYAENVCWQHRRCNYMQGERNIETALNYMYGILKRHGKIQ